jgi:hypothetical protein
MKISEIIRGVLDRADIRTNTISMHTNWLE